LRSLDKLGKIGPEKVAEEMTSANVATPDQARQIVRLSEITGSNEDILRQIEPLVAGSAKGAEGAAQLRELLAAANAAGVPDERIKLDVSIARGLDYYTGTIYETFLDSLPGIGSVCSGGRYDNLADLFTSQELPGVGASLGLDRLLAAMEELGMVEKIATPAEVFIPYFEADKLHEYLKIAAALRAAGIGVEVYPDAKKLGQQLKYADRRGFRIALIAGGDEFSQNRIQIKDLQKAEKRDVPLDNDFHELIATVKEALGVS
jgi:histidyl-tRNA synthetase